MAYDTTNRGAIWKNDDKREDAHPDFKGSLNVDGVEYWVSAWKRKEGAPAKSPALSFSVKPKEQKPARPGPGLQGHILPGDLDDRPISQRAMPKGPARDRITTGPQKQNIIPDDDMNGDRIPF